MSKSTVFPNFIRILSSQPQEGVQPSAITARIHKVKFSGKIQVCKKSGTYGKFCRPATILLYHRNRGTVNTNVNKILFSVLYTKYSCDLLINYQLQLRKNCAIM